MLRVYKEVRGRTFAVAPRTQREREERETLCGPVCLGYRRGLFNKDPVKVNDACVAH